MGSFGFKQRIDEDKFMHASLQEQLAVKGDHVVINWLTNYEGRDL